MASATRSRLRRRRSPSQRGRLRRSEPPVHQPRALHLVDVDNLIGDPRTTDGQLIASTFDLYRLAADYRLGDLVVVATGVNGAHVLAVELAWPCVAHRRQRGLDGADRLLIEEAAWAAEHQRFGRVVVGSGDGIFVPTVERLRDAGIDLRVVSRPRSLSRALARVAGSSVRLLPDA